MRRRRKIFFVRKPKWQIVFVILIGFLLEIRFTNVLGGVQANKSAVSFDLIVFYVGIFFWLFFFAQFLLPVRQLRERLRVAHRLFLYLFGRHGPAIFVENGKAVQRGNEINLTRRGICLIDSASAAMLRTNTAFTRPVGPGVTFTLSGERVAATVDLRRQVRLLGPNDDDDPFSPQGKKELDGAFHNRMARRWETSALTRDGIEIVPRLILIFKLQSKPYTGNTPFGFDATAVQRAATGEGIDPELAPDDDSRNVSWDDLPGRLAVNVWRETLPIFSLNELFSPLPPNFVLPGFLSPLDDTRPTGLDFIRARIKERLTQSLVQKIDQYGQVVGQVWSPEYKILHAAGVEVIHVVLNNLHLREEIDEHIVRLWQSGWLDYAQKEKEALDQELAAAAANAQHAARREYADQVVGYLAKESAGSMPPPVEMARELVRTTLTLTIRNERLNQQAGAERAVLLDLISKLQEMSS